MISQAKKNRLTLTDLLMEGRPQGAAQRVCPLMAARAKGILKRSGMGLCGLFMMT